MLRFIFLKVGEEKEDEKKIRKEINVSMVAGIRKKSFKVKSWEVIFFFFHPFSLP